MQITLYKNKSALNKLNKYLTNARTINVSLKNNCDILSPVITLGYSSSIVNYNYCYIPEFKRYYYIVDSVYDNKELHLSLKVDVLMSWKNDIKNANAHIVRTNTGNLYIKDQLITTTTRHSIECKQLGDGFRKETNYVITIGGTQ